MKQRHFLANNRHVEVLVQGYVIQRVLLLVQDVPVPALVDVVQHVHHVAPVVLERVLVVVAHVLAGALVHAEAVHLVVVLDARADVLVVLGALVLVLDAHLAALVTALDAEGHVQVVLELAEVDVADAETHAVHLVLAHVRLATVHVRLALEHVRGAQELKEVVRDAEVDVPEVVMDAHRVHLVRGHAPLRALVVQVLVLGARLDVQLALVAQVLVLETATLLVEMDARLRAPIVALGALVDARAALVHVVPNVLAIVCQRVVRHAQVHVLLLVMVLLRDRKVWNYDSV